MLGGTLQPGAGPAGLVSDGSMTKIVHAPNLVLLNYLVLLNLRISQDFSELLRVQSEPGPQTHFINLDLYFSRLFLDRDKALVQYAFFFFSMIILSIMLFFFFGQIMLRNMLFALHLLC